MLGPENAYQESHWEWIHDQKLCEDVCRMQDLNAAIEFEDRMGLASRRKKIQRAQRHRRSHDPKDELGHRYGLLTVIARSPKILSYGRAVWICRCDCGRERMVSGVALRRGDVKSCNRLRHPRVVKPSPAGRTDHPAGR